MKKLYFFLIIFVFFLFGSCNEGHKDITLKSDVITLPSSHFYYLRFNNTEMFDWKCIEFVVSSDANDLNYFVSIIPFSFFIGHEKDEYDSLITTDVINKYKINDSSVSKSKNYHFQYNRKKKDDLAALDMFILYFEDTSLGILSATSSNVSFKILSHK